MFALYLVKTVNYFMAHNTASNMKSPHKRPIDQLYSPEGRKTKNHT